MFNKNADALLFKCFVYSFANFLWLGHLLSEKGSLLTRQAVHTRTFTWKAAWKIQLYFTKVLLHTFESEQSTTCFQQHETSVSQLNLCWFMLRITDLSHGQHLGTDWPQFSHMICVSAGPTTAEQDGHTPTPQQSCKLTLFSTTKKEERRKNTGILVWKRQATSQCVKTEYSPKWICGIITSELALVSDGTSVGARPVGWEWCPLEARVYYCLCTNNISEPRVPAGIVLVCMTTLL